MSICSRCGDEFSCGMVDSRDQPCWCVQLPKLPRSAIDADPEGSTSCLCPSCLKARIAEAAQDSRDVPPGS